MMRGGCVVVAPPEDASAPAVKAFSRDSKAERKRVLLSPHPSPSRGTSPCGPDSPPDLLRGRP